MRRASSRRRQSTVMSPSVSTVAMLWLQPMCLFQMAKKSPVAAERVWQLSSSRALRPSRTMHSRQQSRLDPSPFIVRTMIGFRHSIAGQPVKQAASCSVSHSRLLRT